MLVYGRGILMSRMVVGFKDAVEFCFFVGPRGGFMQFIFTFFDGFFCWLDEEETFLTLCRTCSVDKGEG